MSRASRHPNPHGGAPSSLAGFMMFFVVASGAPGTVLAADPASGKALALQWCSACHLVAEDQPTASSTSLPSFYDMAKDPEWSEEKLAVFLADPHPTMPGMSLSNTEIADLASYIGLLKP